MTIRALFGLCDHRWQSQSSRLIEHSVGMAQGYGEQIVTGYTEVRECERCGAVKGFRL